MPDNIEVEMECMSIERADYERAAHRQRVAELCRRMVRRLGVKGPAGVALILAAAEHRDGIRPVAASRTTETTGASFECVVADMAEAILRARQGTYSGALDSGLDLAVGIFDACDEFDEAVELAALDRTAVPQAMSEFFEDASPRFEPRILSALRRVTTPQPGCTELLSILTGEFHQLPDAALELMRTGGFTPAFELASIMASGSEVRRRLATAPPRRTFLSACFDALFTSSALTGLWEHSKIVAVHAYELAAECGYDRGTAFIAGILHDVGRLITQRFPSANRLEESTLVSTGFPLTYAECLIYGTDHAALGSIILKKWDMPAEIVEAVASHHSPENTKSALAGLLNLAEEAALSSSGVKSESSWRNMRRTAATNLAGIEFHARRHALSSLAS